MIATANQPLDRIVATINGDVVTLSRLNEYCDMLIKDIPEDRRPPISLIKKQALNKLILDTIQGQIASSRGINVGSYTIDQQLKDTAQSQNLSLKEFKTKMAENGIDYQEYRKYIKTEITNKILQEQELNTRVNVSEADIDSFLNSPIGQDKSGVEYRLQHILISVPDNPSPDAVKSTLTKAKQIVAELRAGKDFSKVAIENSDGQRALHGGDLGYRKLAQIPTLFVAEIPGMELNDISEPIRSSNGFHIIKLAGKKTGNDNQAQEYKVRQILIKPSNYMSDNDVEDELNKIRQEIENGASFAKVASQKSEELSTSAKGGDMGWVTNKVVLPEFYEKISGLKQGVLSRPFKTQMGWHLVEVTGTRTAATSKEAARNKAREILSNKKYAESIMMWFKQIRNKANVEILMQEYA